MALPVSRFVYPEPGTHEHQAVQKAMRERPRVRLIGKLDGVSYYLVQKTSELGLRRIVQLWQDTDVQRLEDGKGRQYTFKQGEYWHECSCQAGTPLWDTKHGQICWLPKACYHVAAVLIYAANVNETDKHRLHCPECGGIISDADQHEACLDEAQSRA